jgi:hypothetical protein
MDKYNRFYKLLIEKRNGQTLEVRRPFTVEFDIHRNSLNSANVGSFRIYNLNTDNRNEIRKDQYNTGDVRKVVFQCGYGDDLSLAFVGNINQAWSVREGTNYITQIESYDGGFAYAYARANLPVAAGTPNQSIVETLTSSLSQYGISRGAIGEVEGQSDNRGMSITGNPIKTINELSNNSFFIDNGKANVLSGDIGNGVGEAIDTPIPIINAKSGLLGTPVKESLHVNFDMLFEPGLKVAQLIKLVSSTEARFNQIHKVISLKHKGVISDSICGTAVTSVGLLPGSFITRSAGGT